MRYNPVCRSERIARERGRVILAENAGVDANLGNKFDFLFEDAMRRVSHQQIIDRAVTDSECTFRPDIKVSQRQHSSTPGDRCKRRQLSRNVSPFLAGRLTVDSSTGQPLYHPRVGRPPKGQRNAAGLPIGEYLYEQQQQNKKETRRPKEEKGLQIQAESKKLVENRKVENFVSIFKTLDGDADGVISAKNISVSGKLIARRSV